MKLALKPPKQKLTSLTRNIMSHIVKEKSRLSKINIKDSDLLVGQTVFVVYEGENPREEKETIIKISVINNKFINTLSGGNHFEGKNFIEGGNSLTDLERGSSACVYENTKEYLAWLKKLIFVKQARYSLNRLNVSKISVENIEEICRLLKLKQL